MLIKGEKYACEACVRGHRVSNCQHSDRPLQHINKKGRPVSQCAHCRTLRKSRSAHVRCDCGGDKSHAKGACHEGESQADNCCCSHGTRCTCALKKEHLDPVPESDSDEAVPVPVVEKRSRPRALTTNSESGLTVFANGHHKPVHKHNNMAHKCGLPYVVPRANTIHGLSPAGLANRSVDNLPHTSTIEALHSDSHIKDSMVSAQQEQRKVKSEHGSPIIGATSNLELLNGQLPPLDISTIPGDFNFLANLDGFSSIPDQEQPMFSAGLSSASIDWSHYDGLDFNNDNFATSSYSQAPSFTGFDFSSIDQPTLTTTSTSGEISEVEDFIPLNESGGSRPSLLNNKYGSDFDASDYGNDVDSYRLSTASSYIGMPQSSMLSTSSVDDIDTFIKGLPTSNGFVNGHHGLPIYTDEGKLSQESSPYEDSNSFPLLPAEEENDTLWMSSFSPGSITISTGITHSELPDENVWAQ